MNGQLDPLGRNETARGLGMSRRGLLRTGASFGLLLGVPPLLAACGSNGPGPSQGGSALTPVGVPTALPGGTPVRGGTFTVGTLSGGATETLVPGLSVSTYDFARCGVLYEGLWDAGENVTPIVNRLCINAEPNSDGTLWTLELRDGVTWHDGKAFSADDVVYNFQKVFSDPTANYGSGLFVGLIDLEKVRKVSRLVVEVPMLRPLGDLPALMAGNSNLGLVPEGATTESLADRPIGTGPYKFESFTPGRESVFVANEDYWEEGKPYVDRYVVNSSFTDDTARVNALRSGQIDLAPYLPNVTARQQLTQKEFQLLSSPLATLAYFLAMRVDEGPLADNRVRSAMKLLVDRQALVNGALNGLGEVSNDLVGLYAEHFADDLKPEHDVERAKSLLREAGVEGETFELYAYSGAPGAIESATLFAEQAAKAGIKVEINKPNAADYFTESEGFLTRPFAQSFLAGTYPSLAGAYLALLLPESPYNETHWCAQSPGGEEAADLIRRAMGSVDKAEAADLWRRVQEQQLNEGGNLLWGSSYFIDGAANNVRGIRGSANGPFGAWRIQDGWLDA